MDWKLEVKTPFEDPEYLYKLSGFDILKITPDETDQKKIKKAVKELKLKSKRTELVIKGEKITSVLIQRAVKISESSLHHIAEEISTHRPHRIDKEGLKEYFTETLNTKVEKEDCEIRELELDIKKMIEPIPEFSFTQPVKKKMDFIELEPECFDHDMREEISFDL